MDGVGPMFSSRPLEVLREWESDPIGVRDLGESGIVVSDPVLARTVLKSTSEPFHAESAPFGRVPGWDPGSVENRPVTAAMGRLLDNIARDVDPGRLVELLEPGGVWPAAVGEMCLQAVVAQLLPGAERRLVVRLSRALAGSAALAHPAGRRTRWQARLTHSQAMAALYRRTSHNNEPVGIEQVLADALADNDQVALTLHGLIGAACRATSVAMAWAVLLKAGWTPTTDVPDRLGFGSEPDPGDPIRESLRLWPTAWLLHRQVRRPVTLGAHELQPGADVFVCTYLMHRSPAAWKNPLEYQPERWIDPPDGYREGYLPFGIGPAACVGSTFVTVLSAKLLSALTEQGGVQVRLVDRDPVMGPLCSPPRFTVEHVS
ncbi:cytochrome P450 [Kribbella sp. NPDC056951]|uniref:cytochrome P450 n=1 Tax=Kribbella sp. NPDC056951 TaxID=3345978 RepID=UPI00362D6C02